MPRTVDKAEALELLRRSRDELLRGSVGCVLCALVERAAKDGALVAENEHGVVVLDRFGARPGHCLVVARAHVEDTVELGWPSYAELQRLAYSAAAAIRRAWTPERTYVAVLGSSAELPMSFPHFHVHVIPVYEVDERARPARVFSWSSGVVVYDDAEARELAAQLREVWAEPPRGGER